MGNLWAWKRANAQFINNLEKEKLNCFHFCSIQLRHLLLLLLFGWRSIDDFLSTHLFLSGIVRKYAKRARSQFNTTAIPLFVVVAAPMYICVCVVSSSPSSPLLSSWFFNKNSLIHTFSWRTRTHSYSHTFKTILMAHKIKLILCNGSGGWWRHLIYSHSVTFRVNTLWLRGRRKKAAKEMLRLVQKMGKSLRFRI